MATLIKMNCSFKRYMMNHKISNKEVEYLLDHLDTLYTGVKLRQYLSTNEQSEHPSVNIPLSDKPVDKSNIIVINDVPVLFPCANLKKWYSIDGKRVNFHHDILKSAFYLLSGFQEYQSNELDKLGRFPWSSSIQYSLGITQKPIVNYYFEVILEAFSEFCNLNGLKFKRKTGEAPILFLSHDVDKLKKYTIRNLVNSSLEMLGIRSVPAGFMERLKDLFTHTLGLFSFRPDPYWTFKEMTDLEHKFQISSTWYFLERGAGKNSTYHFEDKRIRKLINYLSERGHEIGVHGTLESSLDQHAMDRSIHGLKAVSNSFVSGIRQHELKYSNPITPRIQVESGFTYDATLGFAEQIGFRNSYTYPFRLYDFDNETPMNIWQLPLNAMEVSMLLYMRGKVDSIPEIIKPILSEVTKFKGVFSLLWHNCRLEEAVYPGINVIYHDILREIMLSGYISLTGQGTIDSFLTGT